MHDAALTVRWCRMRRTTCVASGVADRALAKLTVRSLVRSVEFNWLQSGNNSVVECDLAKVEVAGSNPVSRSNFSRALSLRDAHLCLRRLWRLGIGCGDCS